MAGQFAGLSALHRTAYLEALKRQERVGVGCSFGGVLIGVVAFLFESNFMVGATADDTRILCIRIAIAAVLGLRLWYPASQMSYAALWAIAIVSTLDLVTRGIYGGSELNSTGVVVRRLFLMQSLMVGTFFCFRRHAKYTLLLHGVAACTLLYSFRHLPGGIAMYLYPTYSIATLQLVILLAAFEVKGKREFISEQENQDLKDVQIAALTQISHVIKNKLNYVEAIIPDWRDRVDIGDPADDEFGTVLFCIRASLEAVTHVSVLKSLKAGKYETAVVGTQMDAWLPAYAANHGLAASAANTVLPEASIVYFDRRIMGFVLEDGWSNALKYGDTAKFRPEISARLHGRRIEVSITNRQRPSSRLPEHPDILFARGLKGAQAGLLSDGFGLADAKQAAEAGGGTVCLREHSCADADDMVVWYTTFTVSLPAYGHHAVGDELSFVFSPALTAEELISVGSHCPQEEMDVRSPEELRLSVTAGPLDTPPPPFPTDLTILACDDEGLQRKVLRKIILAKLSAGEKSVVLGADLGEVQSVVPLALSLEADIVILDQNLTHGGVTGTTIARELREAAFSGVIVLRTGSREEGLEKLQDHESVDLAVDKGDPNAAVVEAIRGAWRERAGAPQRSGADDCARRPELS